MSRKRLESFVAEVPAPWLNRIHSLVVFAALEGPLEFRFHPKGGQLSIFVSDECVELGNDLMERLAIAVQTISNEGYLVEKLSQSRRNEYAKRWRDLALK